jgi:hypothetical protein
MADFIELVRFRARAGVSPRELLEAAGEVNVFLRGRKGFVRRHLGQAEDGTWHDIVVWESREHVERAMPEAAKSPHCARFFALIDSGNDAMSLFAVALSA